MKIVLDIPVGWTLDFLKTRRHFGQPPIYELCCLSNKTGRAATVEATSIPEAVADMQRRMAEINQEEKADVGSRQG